MVTHAAALRRLMAQRGLTINQVIDRSGLHARTVKAVLRGDCRPHAKTLHRLAAGLECDAAEFFLGPDGSIELGPNTNDGDPHAATLRKAARVLEGPYGDVLAEMIEVLAGRHTP